MNGKFVVFSEGNLVSNQGPRQRPAGGDPGRADRPARTSRRAASGSRCSRVTYVPTWVRLGDYVVLPAKASADQANAGRSSESYARTVDVVGEGNGFGPEF